MANKATKDQKAQVETLSYIDSLVTILGDYPEAVLPLTMDVNPFQFLINICKSLGIFDELMLFLVKLIQYELPLIELGVKGILLANLKEMISCSSDPFIPNYLRKQIYSDTQSGITFSVSDLDFNDLLSINPLGSGAEYSYFGIDRVYKTKFAIVQTADTKNLYDKESGDFYVKGRSDKESQKLSKAKCENDLNEKLTRISKKYSEEGHIITTSITSGSIITQKEKTKTDKNSGEKIVIQEEKTGISYRWHINVKYSNPDFKSGNAIPLVDDGNVTSLEKEWETYLKADSHLQTKTKHYKHKYKFDLKRGAVIQKSIKSIVYTEPYELARAKDFNAFLWLLVHQIDFSNSLPLTINLNTTDAQQVEVPSIFNVTYDPNIDYSSLTEKQAKKAKKYKGPLGIIKFTQKTDEEGVAEEEYTPPIGLLGSSFVLKGEKGSYSAIYDLCIKVEYIEPEENGLKKQYTLVRASSDNISLNWYADRGKYYDFLKYWASPKKESTNSPRNYAKEFGICNIEFDTSINDTNEYKNFNRNQLRFTVLPKPLVYVPTWLDSELTAGVQSPWTYKTLLFNNRGELDSNGVFSAFVLREDKSTVGENFQPKLFKSSDSIITHPYYYKLTTKGSNNVVGRLYIPHRWKGSDASKDNYLDDDDYGIRFVEGDREPGSLELIKCPTALPPYCLYETYSNLTIYEFNYDYVMSQRLFDPKVMAGQLIQSILNCRLGISGNLNVSVTHNVTEETEQINNLVKKLVEANNVYSSSDCYFNFSNDEYDRLMTKTEQKKSNGYHFEGTDRTVTVDTTSIEHILDEYNNPDITPEGQTDVLNRAFNEVTNNLTAAVEGKETWDIKFDIISQLIQDLTFEIVKCILTPKIMMILMVNKQLLGDASEWKGNVLENLMGVLIGMVTSIVTQIKDMLLKKLLDFVLSYLKPKFEELAALIVKEYIEQYRDQLAALIKACGIGWGWKAATADTQIDYVDYADIDPLTSNTNDTEC